MTDLGFLTGFSQSGDTQGLDPQALLQRKQQAAQGGSDQSGFSDPTAGFFNMILKQLNAPPLTQGGTKHLEMDFSKGVDPQHPYDVAFSKGWKVNSGHAQGPLRFGQPIYGDNWDSRTNQSKLYSKYGPAMGYKPDQYIRGEYNFTPTGEAAAAPDFSRLTDLANQAFGGQGGDFTTLLKNLQKEVGANQQLAGTFESMAGAAAGGAAGAALMTKMKALLAPQLTKAAGQSQGYNYELTLNGNPLASNPLVIGPNPNGKPQTVLEYQASQGAAQLKTNMSSGGLNYAR